MFEICIHDFDNRNHFRIYYQYDTIQEINKFLCEYFMAKIDINDEPLIFLSFLKYIILEIQDEYYEDMINMAGFFYTIRTL